MGELEFMDVVMGVVAILSGIIFMCYPKYIYGYRKWPKARQEAFDIKGYSRLVGSVLIISGMCFIISLFFGYESIVKFISIIVYLIVMLFMDKRYYKKRN